ncbi:MAG TPA: LPS assembly protein LptD [Candidatus Binataceae bacterium]|nr:LPS assembly protein LptD [Candidatus Binataceae bacterium]
MAARGCSLKPFRLSLLSAIWLAFLAAPAVYSQTIQSLGGLSATHAGKVDLSGNEFVYDARSDTFIARGDARLRQAGTLLQAHEMQFNRKTQNLMATGDVNLSDPDVDLTASRAEVNMTDETGELQNAKITVKQSNYYLAGRDVTKLLGQHYRVIDGYFTTCGCESGAPSWSIAGREMDIALGGKGVVKDVRFRILDHTVLDVPYGVFPADTDRQSGFLSPLAGQSRLRGFQYFQPYYIDINRSSDATVALDVETSARIGTMAEYRLQNGADDYARITGGYFNESIRSNANNDVVDDQIADPNVPINRWGFIGQMREHITPTLVAFADPIYTSDSLYLRDMDLYTLSQGYGSNFGLLRTGNSDFGLQQSFENSYARLDGMWIQDYIQAQQFALQTMPELLWSGRQNLGLGAAYVDYDFQGVDYLRKSAVDGLRFDLHPRLTVPWRLQDYVYGSGTLGLEETVYDVSGDSINIIPVGTFDPQIHQVLNNNNQLSSGPLSPGGLLHREMIDGSFQIGSRLERVYKVKWKSLEKLKHTIEPVLSYAYVPVVDQSQLPIFDETDRIEPRSLFTYGVVSRLYGKFGAREDTSRAANPEDSGVTQPASFQTGAGSVRELAEFSLLHMYDTSHSLTPSGSRFSDISANLSVFPSTYASVGSMTDFNPNTRQFAGETVFLALRPPWVQPAPVQQQRLGRSYQGGPYLQVNYSFVGGRTAVQQISGRAYYEFFDRIGFYYEPAYDVADTKLLYSEYGLRLKSKCDCWIFDMGVNDSINPREVQIFVQLTLGGLGSIGRSPFGRNILLNNTYGTSRGPWD